MMYATLTTYLSFTLITILGSDLYQNEPPKPSRTVKDQVLSSTDKPAIRLQFDKSFKYIGAQSFILYGVAGGAAFLRRRRREQADQPAVLDSI